jgi:hypothetical protein
VSGVRSAFTNTRHPTPFNGWLADPGCSLLKGSSCGEPRPSASRFGLRASVSAVVEERVLPATFSKPLADALGLFKSLEGETTSAAS